ncbi:MAG: cytochrome C [Gammaproteobacteria bacterium]
MKFKTLLTQKVLSASGGLLLLAGLAPAAHAVPSFARQLGVSCSACHTVYPQLTPFGRRFKALGYTMTNGESITQERNKVTDLNIDKYPPLSLMIQVADSVINKHQPGSQKNNAQLPTQMSLFYAGRISPKVGSFMQLTYDGAEDHISLDNTDVRFADQTNIKNNDLIYGVVLNNSPTVGDLWNSTPAWGYPYATPNTGVTGPDYATQLDGQLAQQVAGLGVYGFWNGWLYGQVSAYRSSQLGNQDGSNTASSPGLNTGDNPHLLAGEAPYWRLALEHNWGSNSWEVGTYGMDTKVYTQGTDGPTDKYLDTAVDTQYQYLGNNNTVTVHATYIHEKMNMDGSYAAGAASSSSDHLDTAKIDATYFNNSEYGGTLAYFNTTGSTDPLLFSNGVTGKPDTSGWIAELDYVPWVNTKFALQYIGYDKFDGSSSNYDGSGRSASDNNTISLGAWLMY